LPEQLQPSPLLHEANRSPTMPADPNRGFRRLRLLALILAISNLLVGLISVAVLRKVDREYSELIDQSVPILNEIRIADTVASKLYQAVIAALVTPDPEKCSRAVAQARHFLDRGKVHRARVLAGDVFHADPALAAELRNSGEAYETAVTALLPRLTPENTADAERDRIEQLRTVYDRYALAIRHASSRVAKQTESVSEAYTATTWQCSLGVLGLAGWPVVLMGLAVVLTGAVVVVMLVVVRMTPVGDGP